MTDDDEVAAFPASAEVISKGGRIPSEVQLSSHRVDLQAHNRIEDALKMSDTSPTINVAI